MPFTLQYIPISGIKGINGSIHFFNIDGKKIILDAGINPNQPEETIEKFLQANEQPHAIVVSHAHIDHLGALPSIIKFAPHARIYMTYPTLQLAERMLIHHYNLSVKKAKEKWEKLQLNYSLEELEQMFYIFQAFHYKKSFPIHHFFSENVEISLWDAGHILGSALVLIRYKNKNILYTGNFRLSPQSIMKGATLPGEKIDILILEATYGDDPTSNTKMYSQEKKRLIEFINATLKMNGKVLLPVFALGRTQEMIHLLYKELLKGNLEPSTIFITGLGNSFTRIYDSLRKFWQKKSDYSLMKLVQNLHSYEKLPEKSIILATSGFMREGTYSIKIAKKILNDPRCGIGFVGYLEPDSPGYRLRMQHLQKLRYESVLLQGAKIETFHFSAHASQQELLKMVELTSPRVVILFHGEVHSMNVLKNLIQRKFPDTEVIIPKEGEMIDFSYITTD